MSSRSHGSHGRSSHHGRLREFPFKVGDLVLVKWSDGMVYFAKIKRIDLKRRKCTVVFDDKSQDEAAFSQIHSVDETTTDIICIKCKKDDSEAPNEIVLCDTCGIGYHQKCHTPYIPATALNIDTPWQCTYCGRGEKCPYLTESLDALQNLLSESESESEETVLPQVEHRPAGTRRSRRVNDGKPSKVDSDLRPPRLPPLERKRSPLSNANVVRHKLAAAPLTPVAIAPHTSLATHSFESESLYTPESTPESTPEPSVERKRKRKNSLSHSHKKKHKRLSVDTHTVSVTRLPIPVVETGTPDDKTIVQNAESHEPRPRSFRISLSIEEDSAAEGEIRVKTPGSSAKVSPTATPLSPPAVPSWDELAKSEDEQLSDVFPSVSIKVPRQEMSVILKAGKSVDSPVTPVSTEPKKLTEPSVAFTASPLPITNIPDFDTIDDMFEMIEKPLSAIEPVKAEVTTPKEVPSPTALKQQVGTVLIPVEPENKAPSPTTKEHSSPCDKPQVVKRASVVTQFPPSQAEPHPSDAVIQSRSVDSDRVKSKPVTVQVVSSTPAPKKPLPQYTAVPVVSRSPASPQSVTTLNTKPSLPTSVQSPTTSTVSRIVDPKPQTNSVIHKPTTLAIRTPTITKPALPNVLHTPVVSTPSAKTATPTSTHTPKSSTSLTRQTPSPPKQTHSSLARHTPSPPKQTHSSLARHTPSPPKQTHSSLVRHTPSPPKQTHSSLVSQPLPSSLVRHAPSPPSSLISQAQKQSPSVLAKRPLSEDVIITGVEKNQGPPLKKPNIESPAEKKESPVEKKKEIPTRQVVSQTGVAPQTTAVVTNPPSYSTIVDGTATNKHQYVYCVQSSPGAQPVYIPASVIQQTPRPGDNPGKPSPLVASSPPVYYTSEMMQPAHVNTTKPYAIVNAIPSTSMNMYPRQLTQVQLSEAFVVDGSQAIEKQKRVVHTPSSAHSMPSDELNSHLQTINKNISAAFTNSNEEMLMSAFEDAWKKFQANGSRYKQVPKSPPRGQTLRLRPHSDRRYRTHVPPNAEVVTVSKGPNKLSLLRPVGQRPHPVAPKTNRSCALCGSEATYLCSGCKTEWYCGRKCQLKAWDKHSETCKN